MSSYKEKFASSFYEFEKKREETAYQNRLDEANREKKRALAMKKNAEEIFSRHKVKLINHTLNRFLAKIETCSKPPYTVTYDLKENIRGASSLLKKMIETSLENELPYIPKMVLDVCVYDASYTLPRDASYIEPLLRIKISLNF